MGIYDIIYDNFKGYNMINSDEFVDLNKCVNEDEINSLFLYVDRYFSDIELTNAQLENCAKLSNYIKRNNLVIGDIESERLIENSKIFDVHRKNLSCAFNN